MNLINQLGDYLIWPAYLFDIFLTHFFFRKLEKSSRGFTAFLAATVLLLYFPLMMRSSPIQANVPRFLLRWMIIFLFLLLHQIREISRAVYFSALCALSFLSIQNFIIVSKWLTQHLTANATVLFLSQVFLEYLVPFLIFFFISSKIQFNKIHQIHYHQIIIILSLVVVCLYVKESFFLLAQSSSELVLQNYLYPLGISALSLFIVAFLDQYFLMQIDRDRQIMANITKQHQYENLLLQMSAQKEVQRIHHDLKNHLLTISALPDGEKDSYVRTLLKDMSAYSNLIETGNATLNVLINQKAASASSENIEVQADIDIAPVSYLDPVDICSIFGNALDNAFEAAKMGPPDQKRYVHIKSGVIAQLFVMHIANSYAEPLTIGNNGLPSSTKQDNLCHGFGMENIRRSLQRYGGFFTYTAEQGKFVLKITLPIHSPVQNE